MNELKLSLHNFQSISDGELVFRTGLNFIIGQSNSGKSATFRALKACLLNPKGSQRFIKKGHNKAEVKLEYNGNEIIWDRTSKESTYTINGEVFYKTGSSNAFKILNEEAGFARDDNGTLMNIEEELQLPFPFGISHSDLFKLFENVFCVSDSAIILKSAKEYEKGVETEVSTLEFDLQKTNTKLRDLAEFKEYVDFKYLTSSKRKLGKAQERILFLSDGKEIIEKAIVVEKANLEVREEDFKDWFSPYLTALECRKVLAQTHQFHLLSKNLQELDYDVPKLLEKYTQLRDLNKTLSNLKKLNKIKVIESSFENKLSEYQNLKALYSFIQDLKVNIQSLQEKEKREKARMNSIEEKLKEFKVCPLCHHSLEN